jgi:hypothetical protein
VIDEGSLTVKQLQAHIKEKHSVSIDSISCGTCIPWSQWGGNQAAEKERYEMKVEDAWCSIMGDTLDNLLPAGRYYVTMNVTGSHIAEDGTETDA